MENIGKDREETYFEEQKYLNNLHPVFKTMLDTFSNVTDLPKVTGHITLWDALQKIRYNLGQDINPKMFLTPKYLNGKKNTDYDRQKDRQPAICYNASFNGYKNLKNTKAIHNLMFLDIDGFSSREEVQAYKDEVIKKYDWILACSLSLSKIGLHIIVMVDRIADNNDFNRKYDFISKEYFDGKLDKTSKSLSRFTILPYDNNIYINDSPTELPIDSIISKSTGSAYLDQRNTSSNALSPSNSKSTSSGYLQSCPHRDKKKSTCSAEEGEIIYTTHTLSSHPSINGILSTAARDNGLVFKPVVNEGLITDPNIPLYFSEGKEVIEINLFLYKHKSIPDGRRTRFIGAMTTQMIYLNVATTTQPLPDVRKSILRFILWVNKRYCAPPLSYSEVLKSYNSNWNRYENGEMDFTRYYKLKRSFWSQKSTLSGNQKRSVSMTLYHKSNREKKLEIMREVLQQLADNGETLTQQIVAGEIKKRGIKGLGITTIKNLWKHFKPSIQAYKKAISNDIKISETDMKDKMRTIKKADIKDEIAVDDDVLDLGKDFLENRKNISFKQNSEKKTTENICLSDEQITTIYNKIYSGILTKLKEEESELLFTLFEKNLIEFKSDDKRILLLDSAELKSNEFWRQGTLENQLLNLYSELNI